MDLGTGMRMCDLHKSLDMLDVVDSIQQFAGAEHHPPKKRLIRKAYSDNWPSYRQACKALMIQREYSLPGVPKTNARIERVVQDTLDGARTLLFAAGLPTCWGTYALPAYCNLHNIVMEYNPVDPKAEVPDPDEPRVAHPEEVSGVHPDEVSGVIEGPEPELADAAPCVLTRARELLERGIYREASPAVATATKRELGPSGIPAAGREIPEGGPCLPEHVAMPSALEIDEETTPWFRRHKTKFTGMVVPFGAGVYFKPAPTRYTMSKLAPRLTFGIFLGYRMAPGQVWNGEYLVADLDEIWCKLFVVAAPRASRDHVGLILRGRGGW